MSMMRSVIAIANTPSEKVSILLVPLSCPPFVAIKTPLCSTVHQFAHLQRRTQCLRCSRGSTWGRGEQCAERAPRVGDAPFFGDPGPCAGGEPAQSNPWTIWDTSVGALRQLDLEGGFLAVPEDRHVYGVAGLVVAQGRDQVSRAPDLLGADDGHYVAAPHPGVVGGTAGLDVLDQSARIHRATEFSGRLLG